MNTITIIQHNINGWNNKRFELYNTYRHINPDIILLNHTGTIDDEQIRLQHYQTYTKNTSNRRFNGTAIAIKSTIEHKIIDDTQTDLLAINIQTRQGIITIATDYVNPNAEGLNLTDYMHIIRRNNPVYILGDLNARHSFLGHSNPNPVGRNIYTLLEENRITHLGPHFPTYIHTRACTSPDIVLANRHAFYNIQLQPGPITSSDHVPIIAQISANPIQIPIKPRPNFRRANWEGFKTELEQYPTPNLNNAEPKIIDRAIDNWTKQIQTAANNHIPTLKYRIPPSLRPNNTITNIQNQLDRIYNLLKQHGHNHILAQELIVLRNQLQTEYKIEHDRVTNNIIENIDNQSSSQHFWKSIKKFQNPNFKQKSSYLRDPHNNQVDKTTEKEKLFTKYCTKTYTKYNHEEDAELNFDQDNINTVNHSADRLQNALKTHETADLNRLDRDFPPITHDELTTHIQKLKQKSPGPSEITANHLKNIPENMINTLKQIFNASLSAGYFPKPLKISHTIYLPKPNKPQYQVENYRPITLLETHGKILDKILNKRLINHLQITNKLNPKQHGFTPNRGTDTALITLYESITQAKWNYEKADIVLRDISKAFDKVWHTGLKVKISRQNVHPLLLKILTSYLTNRQTSVKIDTHIGTPIKLECGVPQGGCLSPTLYNIYTADTPEPTLNADHVIYADDLTQIITHKEPQILQNRTETAIKHITQHESKWKIRTNTDKFQIIPFFRLPRNQLPITINNNTIPYSISGKVLGLTITTKGLQTHVKQILNKVAPDMKLLQSLKNLTVNNKLKIYKTLILPKLTFPVIPLHTLTKAQMIKLQIVQNNAVRIITNTNITDRVRIETLHNSIKLDPINITLHKLAKKKWESY